MSGRVARTDIDPEALRAWAKGGVSSALPGAGGREFLVRTVLVLVAATNLLTVTGWMIWDWGPSPFLAVAMLQILWNLATRRHIKAATGGVTRASRDLNLTCLRLCSRSSSASRLRAIVWSSWRRSCETAKEPPASRNARQLQRLVDLLDSMRNALFVPFGLLLLWTPQLAYAIDSILAPPPRRPGRHLAPGTGRGRGPGQSRLPCVRAPQPHLSHAGRAGREGAPTARRQTARASAAARGDLRGERRPPCPPARGRRPRPDRQPSA